MSCVLTGLDLLAHRKREKDGNNAFKPPPQKVVAAASSMDEDEKPGSTENDASSLSGGDRGNMSRRYRGTNSSEKTSSKGTSSSADLLTIYTPVVLWLFADDSFSVMVFVSQLKLYTLFQNLQSLMRMKGVLHPDIEMNPIGIRSDNNIYPAFSCLLGLHCVNNFIYVHLTIVNNSTFLCFLLIDPQL